MIEALLEAERLLVMGMLDQAEEIYRRAADADPRNAIAVVGLARVALERGDEQLAYRHACAALEIDPRDGAALRLEARLSEVLATRRQPVQRPPWLQAQGGATVAPEETHPAPAPDAEDLGLAAQRAALTRNPSMADHRRRMEQTQREGAARESTKPAHESTKSAQRRPTRRRGLLRRLLGR